MCIRDRQWSGASVSRKAKLVLVGCGLAGKTSTLRGLQHGKPRPTDVDARTVQLDIWSLLLRGAENEEIVASAWDFGGQPEYAPAQQAYLVAGALYLLLVPAHKIGEENREENYEEVCGRWLDTLGMRAPGAAVQLVLCLLYTSPSPRDGLLSRMPSSA